METLDLNINNYKLEDILKLFEIPLDFNENDLKVCKRKVLMMHPDKSNLSKEYFLFFCETYKILYSIYSFKNKAQTNENMKNLNNKIEYLVNDEDEANKEIVNNLKQSNKLDAKEFNSWFNELFDKVNLTNDYTENGYGNWLKSEDYGDDKDEDDEDDNEDKLNKTNNMYMMNKIIEKRKEKLRETQLSKYSNINEYNNNNYCDLTNSKPESYTSDMFSKLQFEDLKIAHEESVVPVNDKDFKQQYRDFEDIRLQRQNQNVNPLTNEEYNKIMNNRNNENNVINSNRAFKLYKQQEEIENANKKWWGSLKQLK